jgi:hypothetical protein
MLEVKILNFVTYFYLTSSFINASDKMGISTSFEGTITEVSVYLFAVIEIKYVQFEQK